MTAIREQQEDARKAAEEREAEEGEEQEGGEVVESVEEEGEDANARTLKVGVVLFWGPALCGFDAFGSHDARLRGESCLVACVAQLVLPQYRTRTCVCTRYLYACAPLHMLHT